MTSLYCLCQPRPDAACVERNWRPQAHTYMMRLPQRYLAKDRLLIAALTANGVVARMGARVVPTTLGISLFMSQFKFCCSLFSRCWFMGQTGKPIAQTGERCDARPDCWRPDPGSVAFRTPCTF